MNERTQNFEKTAINVGNAIRDYRKKNKYTQEQFSKMLGISVSTLSNYETGKCLPDMQTLIQLTEMIGCSTDDILSLNRFRYIFEKCEQNEIGAENEKELLDIYRNITNKLIDDNSEKLYKDNEDVINSFR